MNVLGILKQVLWHSKNDKKLFAFPPQPL